MANTFLLYKYKTLALTSPGLWPANLTFSASKEEVISHVPQHREKF